MQLKKISVLVFLFKTKKRKKRRRAERKVTIRRRNTLMILIVKKIKRLSCSVWKLLMRLGKKRETIEFVLSLSLFFFENRENNSPQVILSLWCILFHLLYLFLKNNMMKKTFSDVNHFLRCQFLFPLLSLSPQTTCHCQELQETRYLDRHMFQR